MTLLITGASGFIGSFLVAHALERGDEVWAAVRKGSSRHYLPDPRTHFIELNLEDEAVLREQLRRHREQHGAFDHVIHAAGATKAPDRATFDRINHLGTQHLAQILLELDMLRGRFVFLSSLSVMGNIGDRPIPSAPRNAPDCYRPLSIEQTAQPNTDYGRSKLAAEEALRRISGLNYVILRPTGVYGPRERDYFLMAQTIQKHIDFGAGFQPQVITFIYVRDLVDACFLALTQGSSQQTYLLSDGHDYSSRAFSDLLQKAMHIKGVLHITAPLWVLRTICRVNEHLCRLTGKASPLNMDKYHILSQRNWRCDITPARRQLGFNPQWPLHRGVPETIEWYRKEGWI